MGLPEGFSRSRQNQVIEEIRDPVEAVNWLDRRQDTVLLAQNLHLFLEIPEVVQAIQNGVMRLEVPGFLPGDGRLRWCSSGRKSRSSSMSFALPLPTENELFIMQEDLAKGASILDPSGKEVQVATDQASARAARGLTEFEAETAFALSLVREGKFSHRVISEVKGQMIRKSGLMEFWEPADIADVGGLDNLKTYIRNRAAAFQPGNEHLPRPKGILLVGIPGTGKSLSCKATASILGWPLIRLDIGALKNSLVGESPNVACARPLR